MLTGWLERRRTPRRAWRTDARELIERDETNAYYDAQRLAARARAQGSCDGMALVQGGGRGREAVTASADGLEGGQANRG